MNIAKVMALLQMKNIDNNQIFALVDLVKNVNLESEDEIRNLISNISKVIDKEVSLELENKIIQKIKEEGISPSLLELL